VLEAGDALRLEADLRTLLDRQGYGGEYYIDNIAQRLRRTRAYVTVISIFCYGFTALMALVAVSGSLNTVLAKVRLQRRELAMLRSVGMPDSGVSRMLAVEGLLFGAGALCLGLPLAFAVNLAVYQVILKSLDVSLALPWANIALGVTGVFAVTLATTAYAARMAGREGIAEALASELN
jgi:putative ABC transport system permease protein